MKNDSLFDQFTGYELFMTDKFISNGFLVLPITQRFNLNNHKMIELINFCQEPEKLSPCQIVATLPPLGDLPALVVFAPSNTEPPYPLDQLTFINKELYQLIVDDESLEEEYQNDYRNWLDYRFASNPNRDYQECTIIAVYGRHKDLMGICARVDVTLKKENGEAVVQALREKGLCE